MDSTNGKKILSVISDLEDEIGSFGDVVAGMIDANKDDGFLKAKAPVKMSEEQLNFDDTACLVNQTDLNKNPARFNENLQLLAANLALLKNELEGLKGQLAKRNELTQSQPPATSTQADLAEQVSRLVNYLERKFDEINSNQQLILSANQAREEQGQMRKQVDEQSVWSGEDPDAKSLGQSTSTSMFTSETSEQSDENSIKELGDHYAKFLNELRDDCVKRVKDAIAVESEKIIGRDDPSLKKLFNVITYIIEREKARFQNTLRDINERIFLALDDRVGQEGGENNEGAKVIESAPMPTPVVNRNGSEHKAGRKELIKQMNEIQERLNNNLIKQYQFYGLKKN